MPESQKYGSLPGPIHSQKPGTVQSVPRSVKLSAPQRWHRPTPVVVKPNRNLGPMRFAAIDRLVQLMGSPLLQFDPRNRVMLTASGQPMHRSAALVSQHGYSECASPLDVAECYLRNLGAGSRLSTMGRGEIATLAFSRSRTANLFPWLRQPGVSLAGATGDFRNILADAFGKSLRTSYVISRRSWQQWGRRTTARDFKEIKRVRIEELPALVEMPEAEVYTAATVREGVETFRLAKYGRTVRFTRESFINDDLGAFVAMRDELGRAAARLEEVLAYDALESNPTLSDSAALFSTAHANIVTGALSVTSLGAARSALAAQTGNGSTDPLDLTAHTLLVPKPLATTAEQLVASLRASGVETDDRLRVVSTAHLSSATQWYIAADPAQIDTGEVCFLESEPEPFTAEENEFESDSLKIKVRHTVAAKATDHRGLVRSSGA